MAAFTDDFTGTNGDPPDPTYWTETDVNNTLSIQNNKLNFTSALTSAVQGLADSKFKVVGDFDVQVDFEQVSASGPSQYPRLKLQDSGSSAYALIYAYRNASSAQRYAVEDTSSTWESITRGSNTGKLRITRTGSTLKAYYWSGSQWEWNGNTSGKTFNLTTAATMIVQLGVIHDSNNVSFNFNFDNLNVTADTVYLEEVLSDFSLNLSTVYQKFHDLKMLLRAHDGLEFRNMAMFLETISNLEFRHFKMFLETYGLSLESFTMMLETSKTRFSDFVMMLSATDGTILNNFLMMLKTTDGLVFNSFKMKLRTIAATPAFRSVTAQRVSSIVHEVS